MNIWKVAAAGGTPARVTSGVGLELRPRPSANGQWVAFDHDGNWSWLMRPDGGSVHAPMDWQTRFANCVLLRLVAGFAPDAADRRHPKR